MPVKTAKHEMRCAIAALALGTVAGCSNFYTSYPYPQTDETSHQNLHQILSDNDRDGVKDFGDLCSHSAADTRVSSHGCAIFQRHVIDDAPLASTSCPFAEYHDQHHSKP